MTPFIHTGIGHNYNDIHETDYMYTANIATR